MRIKQRPEAVYLKTFFIVSLALTMLSLVHFADYYLVKDDRIASIQFIRLSPLVTVLGVISLVIFLKFLFYRFESGGRYLALNAAIVVIALIWGVYQVRVEGREFNFGITRYADRTSTWVRACEWIKEQTPVDGLFITPPGNNGFTSLSDRSCIADTKNNPDGALHLDEWFRRLKDLSGGRLPEGRGFDNRGLINQAYDALTPEQLIDISKKYRADYAVISSGKQVPFTALYRNQRYQVVKIPNGSNLE
jgi:hypothetical protein